jgi:23S rRNA (cytosine1962-C5)-methyltransferase
MGRTCRTGDALSEFEDRLRKVAAQRRRWARQHGLTAYRVYDRDIPAWRFVVEVYGEHVHLVELSGGRVPRTDEAIDAVMKVLSVPRERVHLKIKERKIWGRTQYEKVASRGERLEVEENGLTFLVNLDDYVDTGLFLDHRDTRARIRAEAAGKRFLNLFGYTGSFTVYAAAGGAAASTTVDLSATYLAWARDNLERNGLAHPRHELVRADVLAWLPANRNRRYDLAVLDPPPFSTSRAMSERFEVQQDQGRLLRDTLALIEPGGVLYFSTNFRGFTLDEAALEGHRFQELTPGSLPLDVRDRTSHRLWRIVS